MKIQYKKGYIYLLTADAKIVIGNDLKAKAEDADVFIGKTVTINGDLSGKMIVERPGEYESHGVMVQAISDGGLAEILLFSIDVENVNLVYATDVNKPIKKKIIDQIGVNNVLLINIDKDIEKIRDLVEEMDPNIMIPLTTDAEQQIAVSKKLGVVLPPTEKTLNVSADEFESDDDEKPMQLVVLE